jgi:hypothetical protein
MASMTAGDSATTLDRDRLARFVGGVRDVDCGRVAVTIEWLQGGLEAAGVADVYARYLDDRGRPRLFRFVVKVLSGAGRREARVYERLVESGAGGLAPRLLGAERMGDERLWLYLERVRPWRRWPWRDPGVAELVLQRLAQLHDSNLRAEHFGDWNYDAALHESAASTLGVFQWALRANVVRGLPRFAAPVRRVSEVVLHVRRQLLARPWRPQVIHGDAHPGNVVIRRRRGLRDVVLLDWARTRIGSPLEDVSSWLQSLGLCEPEARRRHDRLLRSYLEARGTTALDGELRGAYWLAGACNAFAGALRYHLVTAADPARSPARREFSVAAARDWLRIVRRADASWST